ncbi:MAG: type II toxin-antitoxin system HicB family antitoxin [Elainella sp. Prado103]|nr:type II toxin-antitoxin system HicB family antitoxin [Elainella sp. Prado103]
MNSIHLKYKSYATIARQDPISGIWHGRILNIQDVVSFEGKTQAQAEAEFRKSVDGYLDFCRSLARSPNPPQ